MLRDDARPLFDGLTSGAGLVMVIVSAAAGAATLALVWTARYGLARVTAAAAVVAIAVGWAFAQAPYLLPPELTLDEAAASDATLTALSVSIALGLVVLVPVAVVAVPARAARHARPGVRAARPALPPMRRRASSPVRAASPSASC